jgi:Outer membrane protein beta-barrel domain
MALSNPNHTPDPRPTGDLENLFRQKFAEAEVSPRASLWEQLDHELLVQQNETYRRRLLGYRWAAAASLLLLAGGGTWLGLQPNTAGVATAPVQPAASGATGRAAASSAGPLAGAASRTYVLAGRSKPGQVAASLASETAEAAGADLLPTTAGAANAGLMATAPLGTGPMSYATTEAPAATSGSFRAGRTSNGRSLGLSGAQSSISAPTSLGASLLPDGYALATAPVRLATSLWNAGSAGSVLAGSGAAAARPEVLASVPATPVLTAALPAPVASSDEDQSRPAKARRWKLNAGYAASTFNPNMDFARGSSAVASYSNAAPIRSPDDAYEVAAAEYRDKLQAGLGQQVSLLADYTLNDHWSVAAGVALAQQEATSATSWYFLDGKSATADFYEAPRGSSVRPNPVLTVRNVRYRYRTASLPLNVRYTTNAKQGWALYAKLGAAVNVLLKSRTELEGVPEATQRYTLASADSPYRKVLASLHGGTGVRFRPANATWSLALGPKVETGLNTLNARPTGSFTRRSRPYSVGLEASVEFGNAKAAPVALR